MADYINDDETPVFLINGFMDSGKTAFILYTVKDEYFQTDGTTLLIAAEDGTVKYDAEELKKYRTELVWMRRKNEFTKEALELLRKQYRPERVIIELNGMWDAQAAAAQLPEKWVVYQQITLMDGTTLDSYLRNMKALMGPMLKSTELLIVNRCDGKTPEELLDWKRKLRPMLPSKSDIVMESRFGEIPLETLPEELPFDVEAPVIRIDPEYYGVWFFDANDNPARYDGKTVEFGAYIMRDKRLPKGYFVPGRMAMTCCEADMQFIGYLAHYDGIEAFRDHDFVKVTARVEVKEMPEYEGPGPVLEVLSLVHTAEVKDPVGF